jgi:hypothetical protein
MFERYTESARRVVFFARFEASNYGSRYIETEHLLLGLLGKIVRWRSGFQEQATSNQKFARKSRNGSSEASVFRLPWRFLFLPSARRS